MWLPFAPEVILFCPSLSMAFRERIATGESETIDGYSEVACVFHYFWQMHMGMLNSCAARLPVTEMAAVINSETCAFIFFNAGMPPFVRL
jgi:hypothetical protein